MPEPTDIAIVTGAGSAEGIGAATALALGRVGMRVIVTSTTDRIQERVAELRGAGVDARGVAADLTDPRGWRWSSMRRVRRSANRPSSSTTPA